MTGIWELGVRVLGASNIPRPQLTPLVSAAGVRFPGVGVLPGVPTGAGVKPKAPGMALSPLGTLGWVQGWLQLGTSAYPLRSQPYRPLIREASLWLNSFRLIYFQEWPRTHMGVFVFPFRSWGLWRNPW